jgi:hypothetical protein
MKKVVLGLLVLGQLGMADRYITSWGNTDYSDSSYSWRQFGIKLNTGESTWASLRRSGSCDNIQVANIGSATKCSGGSYWSYSCVGRSGQNTSGNHDSAEKMVEKLVQECN